MLQTQVAKAKHAAHIYLENREKEIVKQKIEQKRVCSVFFLPNKAIQAETRKRKGIEEPKEVESVPEQKRETLSKASASKDKNELLEDDFLFRLFGQTNASENTEKKSEKKPEKMDVKTNKSPQKKRKRE